MVCLKIAQDSALTVQSEVSWQNTYFVLRIQINSKCSNSHETFIFDWMRDGGPKGPAWLREEPFQTIALTCE